MKEKYGDGWDRKNISPEERVQEKALSEARLKASNSVPEHRFEESLKIGEDLNKETFYARSKKKTQEKAPEESRVKAVLDNHWPSTEPSAADVAKRKWGTDSVKPVNNGQTSAITNFDDFLENHQQSDTFDRWLSEESNKAAHENGMFGLTHRQTMDSWEEYLDEIANDLPEDLVKDFKKEIKETKSWHEKNGTIDDET